MNANYYYYYILVISVRVNVAYKSYGTQIFTEKYTLEIEEY